MGYLVTKIADTVWQSNKYLVYPWNKTEKSIQAKFIIEENCVVCYSEDVSYGIAECGHCCFCKNCYLEVLRDGWCDDEDKNYLCCPLCRTGFKYFHKRLIN